VTGREPQKKQRYYSSKVIWLLVILVGVALLVVGLTLLSGDKYRTSDPDLIDKPPLSDSPQSIVSTTAERVTDAEPEAIPDLIDWRFYDEGISELEGSDKFGMIYFTSDDCQPCRKMERETLADLVLLARIDEFIIPIKIESGSQRMIRYSGRLISESRAADIFNIPGYPALLFYDGKSGQYLFSVPGHTNAAKLSQIFDYLQSREFESSSLTLDEYLSGQSGNE
jgi:thioredoxin-related protein